MIFDFNPDIFEEKYFEVLRQILVLLSKEQHFLIVKNLKNEKYEWLFEKEPFKSHFGSYELRDLPKKLQSKHNLITSLYKSFLTKIVIGNNENEIPPENALRILQERSLLVVENKLNEKKFLKGICDKYTSSERGNIYMLVKNAFEREWIETEGGGNGEIKKNLECYVDSVRFGGIEKYKLFTLFDSDKTSENDVQIKSTPKSIIEFLKNIKITDENQSFIWEKSDKIIWHILHKRALENYAPLTQIFIKIYGLIEIQKQDLEKLTPNELDFLKYDKSNIGLKEDKIKEQFPEIFQLNFSYQLLEERCKHHKIQFETNNNDFIEISEIEQILLKIAKII